MHVSPEGHVVQARPPTPHAEVLFPGSQIPLASQQPVGHVVPLHGGGAHVPAVHESPEGQTLQALPPVPHAPVELPDSQKPKASQHPVGQLLASHVMPLQAPPEHESPGGHGRQAAPSDPHA